MQSIENILADPSIFKRDCALLEKRQFQLIRFQKKQKNKKTIKQTKTKHLNKQKKGLKLKITLNVQ